MKYIKLLISNVEKTKLFSSYFVGFEFNKNHKFINPS